MIAADAAPKSKSGDCSREKFRQIDPVVKERGEDLVEVQRKNRVGRPITANTNLKRFALEFLFSFAAIGGMLGLITGTSSVGGLLVLTPFRSQILLGLAGASGLLLLNRRRVGDGPASSAPGSAHLLNALFWGIFLICSDFLNRRFVFYLGSGARQQLLVLAAAAALAALVYTRKKPRSGGVPAGWGEPLLLAVQIAAAVSFLQCANGRLIFSDDHPSFLYRFQELLYHFPRIPFYNTDWNAGYPAREFFATGAVGSFLLFLPFISAAGDFNSLEGSRIYTLLIPYFFIYIVPWSVYLAGRLFGLSRTTSSFAAILALGPSLGYFEWVLKYGTIGFALSSGLLPLVMALALRLGFGPALPRWSEVFAFVLAAYLLLSWPLAAVTILPLALLWLYTLVRPGQASKIYRSKERWIKIAVFSVLTLLLQLPSAIVLIRESKVGELVAGNSLPGSTVKNVEAVTPSAGGEERDEAAGAGGGTERFFKRLRDNLVKVNPLILLFLAPGIIALPRGTVRRAILAGLVGAILLHLIGPYYKPQLELRRMIYPALFIGSIIAAAGLGCLFEFLLRFAAPVKPSAAEQLKSAPVADLHPTLQVGRSYLAAAGLAVSCGLFLLSPATVISVYLNRSIEKFQFAPPVVTGLSRAIAEHGGSGRTFFLGYTLHELGSSGSAQDGGHVAPLANFTGKPLYAFDFSHSRWSIVDPIPFEYRKRRSAGIEEFLDLVNTTAVVTHQKEWVDYCKADPRYVEVYREDRFRLFTRAGSAGYFLQGSGEVLADPAGLAVRLSSPEAVLKFRYFPKLRAFPAGSAELYPVDAFNEESGGGKLNQVAFIGIRRLAPSAPGQPLSEPITIGFFPD